MTILAGIHDTPEDDEANDDGPGSERVFNTQVVIGPDGTIIDYYRKVSLFAVLLFFRKASQSKARADSDLAFDFPPFPPACFSSPQVHLFDVALTGGASSAGPNGPSEAPSTDESAPPAKKALVGESSRIRPGMKINDPIQTEIGKIGLEICYDIR